MTAPRPGTGPAPARGLPPIVALEGIDGAGKTTLAAALCTRLAGAGRRPRSSRLSPQMGAAMRRLVDQPTGGAQRYQDVVPSGFRHAVYVMEAAVQFAYMAEVGEPADLYVFDRWLQTYDAYCDPPAVHLEWVRAVAATVPAPDVLAYVRVRPEVAAQRLAARGDWTAEHWSAAALADELRVRYEAYESMDWPAGTVVVDGSRPADEVLAALAAAVEERCAHTP